MKSIEENIDSYISEKFSNICIKPHVKSLNDFKKCSEDINNTFSLITDKLLSISTDLDDFFFGKETEKSFRYFDTYRNSEIETRNMEDIKYNIELNLFGQSQRKPVQKPKLKELCPNCGNLMFVEMTDGGKICDSCGVYQCGIEKNSIQYSARPKPFGNLIKITQQFRSNGTNNYRLENHLKNTILNAQGKEKYNIPNSVIVKITNELKSLKIINWEKNLKKNLLKKIIKRLKLSKYIDHTPKIYFILTNCRYIDISLEDEEKIRIMFSKLKYSIKANAKGSRKSFPSYSFITRKITELLGMKEYVEHFPLLKSPEKNEQLERMWIKVCEDMELEYIRSM